MTSHRSVRVLAFAAVTVFAALGVGGAVSAQEDGTTTTTQLDLGGEDGSSTTTESTTTTQLDLDGGEGSTTTTESTTTTQLDLQQQETETTTTTQLQVAGDTVTAGVAAPTRVDAGAGGAAGAAQLPMASVLLAAGLVTATGAAAVRVRRSTRA